MFSLPGLCFLSFVLYSHHQCAADQINHILVFQESVCKGGSFFLSQEGMKVPTCTVNFYF